MPYALKFYLLLFVAEVAVFLVARWLSPFGLGVNLVFALAAAYLFQACAYLQRGNAQSIGEHGKSGTGIPDSFFQAPAGR